MKYEVRKAIHCGDVSFCPVDVGKCVRKGHKEDINGNLNAAFKRQEEYNARECGCKAQVYEVE
jgi:hypothetical protein